MTKKIIYFIVIMMVLLLNNNINPVEIYAASSGAGTIGGTFSGGGIGDKITQGITGGSSDSNSNTPDGVMSGAEGFLKAGSGNTAIDEAKLKKTSDFIFEFLVGIALVTAVVIGMIIGIKFMTAGIDEKAKLKELLVPYFAGCVVVFGAFGIWKLAVNILSKW